MKQFNPNHALLKAGSVLFFLTLIYIVIDYLSLLSVTTMEIVGNVIVGMVIGFFVGLLFLLISNK